MPITSKPDEPMRCPMCQRGETCAMDGRGDRAHEPTEGPTPGVSGIGVPSGLATPPTGSTESAKSLDKLAPRHRMEPAFKGIPFAWDADLLNRVLYRDGMGLPQLAGDASALADASEPAA